MPSQTKGSNGATAEAPAPDATQHSTLAEAVLAAQVDMPAIEPDAENPHFDSKFVSLGHLFSKALPVLNRHGLAVMQAPCLNDEGRFVLRTTILHASGESATFDSPLTPAKENNPQAQGSAITYMRRYALAAALGICDQADDDGNEGSRPADPPAANRPKAKAAPVEPTAQLATASQKRMLNGRADGLTSRQYADAIRVGLGVNPLGDGWQSDEAAQAFIAKTLDRMPREHVDAVKAAVEAAAAEVPS